MISMISFEILMPINSIWFYHNPVGKSRSQPANLGFSRAIWKEVITLHQKHAVFASCGDIPCLRSWRSTSKLGTWDIPDVFAFFLIFERFWMAQIDPSRTGWVHFLDFTFIWQVRGVNPPFSASGVELPGAGNSQKNSEQVVERQGTRDVGEECW